MKFSFKSSIGKKIIGSFFFLISILIVFSFLAFYNLGIIENMVYNQLMEKANARSMVKDIIIRGNNISNLIDQYCREYDADEKNALKININDEIRFIKIFIQQIFSQTLNDEEEIIFITLNVSFDRYSDKIQSVLNSSVIDSEFTTLNQKFMTRILQVDKIETELMYKSWENARERIELIKTFFLIFCISAFAIGLVLNLINTRSIINPIANLVGVLDEYGKGNVSVRAEVKSNDEIGFFSGRFNAMLEQINAYSDGIKKTNESLQEKNKELFGSRSRLQALSDATPYSIILCSTDGSVIDVNIASIELFGYTYNEFTKLSITDLNLDFSFKDIMEKNIALVMQGDKPDIECSVVKKNSIIVPVIMRIQKMDLDDKICLLLIITDITESRRSKETILSQYKEIQLQNGNLAEINKELEKSHKEVFTSHKQLYEEKEKMDTTLRSLGEGVITTNVDGRVEFMNRAAEEITGYQMDEASGKTISEIFPFINEQTENADTSPVSRIQESGEVVDYGGKAVLVAKSGEKKIIAPVFAPLRNKSNVIFGIVIIFRDITEKLLMEEEMLKASKLESLGIIAGGIAHDFNNLLTAIVGNISLALLNLKPEDKNFEILMEAEKVSIRTRDLTQQLLTFSRGGEPIINTISIQNLLKDTTTFVLRGSMIMAEYEIPDDLWSVKADEGQISQVVHNLVLNARESMQDGGTVIISAENISIDSKNKLLITPGSYIKISISDKGYGIPKKNMMKIFEPYFTTKDKGHGLGLAVTYSVVKKHNGYIFVDSEIGKGTTFHIYIPAIKGYLSDNPSIKIQNDFTGNKILLMDDEEMILKVGKRMFEHLGFSVTCVKNGEAAAEEYRIAKSSGRGFDLVVMDLTIPGGMGGKEAAFLIKEFDPSAKMMVSSGYSNDPVMANYTEYGFCGVLVKPYNLNDLQNILSACFV